MYDPIVEANGQAEAFALDIPGATALLAEAGVPAVTVRLLFDPENTRRQNEYELIKASAAQAGFDVQPYQVQTDWGTDLSNATSFYDAALFGWQSTSTAVTESDANYRTGAANNFYGYSNATVDGLFDELQVATEQADQEPPPGPDRDRARQRRVRCDDLPVPRRHRLEPGEDRQRLEADDRADDLLRLLGVDRGRGRVRVIHGSSAGL